MACRILLNYAQDTLVEISDFSLLHIFFLLFFLGVASLILINLNHLKRVSRSIIVAYLLVGLNWILINDLLLVWEIIQIQHFDTVKVTLAV